MSPDPVAVDKEVSFCSRHHARQDSGNMHQAWIIVAHTRYNYKKKRNVLNNFIKLQNYQKLILKYWQ